LDIQAIKAKSKDDTLMSTLYAPNVLEEVNKEVASVKET